jgi:hypothetical protein
VHGSITLKVWQGEITLAIPAIRGAQQGKQGGILAEGHYLAVTKSPTSRCKIEREDTNFSNKWV